MEPIAAFILASTLFLGLIRIASTIERILRDRRIASLMMEAEERLCSAGCGEQGSRWTDAPLLCGHCRAAVLKEIAAAIDPWPSLEAKVARQDDDLIVAYLRSVHR